MGSPLVSIIIPAYNAEGCLARSVESVLAQTYFLIEVIVVDDGSSDGTAEVCRGFGDNIRYIYQENAGVSAARNRGIREAKGECIGFLDADDWYLPNKLADMMEAFAEHPQAVAATGVYHDVFEEEDLSISTSDNLFPPSVKYAEISIFDYLAKGNWVVHTSSVLIKKPVFDEIGGFNENLKIGEDIELWSRIGGKYKWLFVNRPLAVYKQDSASSVTSSTALTDHGVDFLFTNSQMKRFIRPEERCAYRRFRQTFAFSRIRLGFKERTRPFVRECLQHAVPPPGLFKFAAYMALFCLPSAVWPVSFRFTALMRAVLKRDPV